MLVVLAVEKGGHFSPPICCAKDAIFVACGAVFDSLLEISHTRGEMCVCVGGVISGFGLGYDEMLGEIR